MGSINYETIKRISVFLNNAIYSAKATTIWNTEI